MLLLPMKQCRITAPFDYYTALGKRTMHYALDFASKPQAPDVFAAHSGRVIESYYGAEGGNTITLRGEFSEKCDVITRYLHLESRAVANGASVAAGQRIGRQGNTGTATTGPHLHFEVWVVPKTYTFSLSGRPEYAVDPLALCHLPAGALFEPNGKTTHSVMPWPEPKTQNAATALTGGYCDVDDVEVFNYPSPAYQPIVGGPGRSRRYFCHFFSPGRYKALYKLTNDGVNWAAVETDWGMLWVPLIAGRCELKEPAPTPKPQPQPEPDPAPEPEPNPDPALETLVKQLIELLQALLKGGD